MAWTLLTYTYLACFLFLAYIYFRRPILTLLNGRKKFICLRCGHCCRLYVKLSKEDIARIERAGKKNFTEKKYGDTYLKQKNGYCPFLAIKDGSATCTIYKYRPAICKNFPERRVFGIKGYDFRCRAFLRSK